MNTLPPPDSRHVRPDLHPFRIEVPQHQLDDLEGRLSRTRWPSDGPATGWERGVPAPYLTSLVEYWRTHYDWREHEARLNAFPQFTTEVDGQTLHYLHVESEVPGALPLVLTHGWPGSPVEFLRVIAPLTDPEAHGGDARDAFHLVIPSLPGYGFSNPVREAGWGNLFRVALAWKELMARLGYDRYAVQGTDVGAGVAQLLSVADPERVAGVHLSGTVAAMPFGPAIDVDSLPEADRPRAARFNRFREDGLGYLQLQATRPQTLAYALADSPVGQLAWVVEKFAEWTDPAARLPEDAVDRDQLLTNVCLYWFTGSGASSAHALYEGMQAFREMAPHAQDAAAPPPPPNAVAVFAADSTVRSTFDPGHAVERWTEFDTGGHFAAMETPGLLVDDLRAFFRPHRGA